MPATASNVYSNQCLAPMYAPELALSHHVKLPNGVTLARGTVLGEITASPGTYKAYASGSSDGSQIQRALLAYDVVVDGSGNITVGGGDQGVIQPSVQAYFSGFFRTSELTGLDAGALTANPSWALINGTVSSGVLNIG